MADPDRYDAIVVTNLCVPTASGVPLRLLPSEIDGVRIVGIDVPGFGIPTHAEAKDILAGAMLNYARSRDRGRAGAAPDRRQVRPSDRGAAGRDVPGRPDDDRRDARPDGSCRWPRGALPRVARTLRRARLRRRRRHPSLLHRRDARVRRRGPPDRRARLPSDTTARPNGCKNIGRRDRASRAERSPRRRTASFRRSGARWPRSPIKGTITLSGYEGSELLVARLLIESGAEVPYVGTACPKTKQSEWDREWLEAHGAKVSLSRQPRRRLRRDGGRAAPTSPSARLRWSRRRRNWASPASTSPT